MQKTHKINARKRHAKNMENDAKMEPKLTLKSFEKLKICEKRHAENRCWILMCLKIKKIAESIDIGVTLGRFLGGLGGLGGGWIQAKDFRLTSFLISHAMHPRQGCGGWKSMPKWTPKVTPKSTFVRPRVWFLRFWDGFWGVWFLMNFRPAKSLPKFCNLASEGWQQARRGVSESAVGA